MMKLPSYRDLDVRAEELDGSSSKLQILPMQ